MKSIFRRLSSGKDSTDLPVRPSLPSSPDSSGSSLASASSFGISSLVFSQSSDGKVKAFRNVRKAFSRARKSVTGVSTDEEMSSERNSTSKTKKNSDSSRSDPDLGTAEEIPHLSQGLPKRTNSRKILLEVDDSDEASSPYNRDTSGGIVTSEDKILDEAIERRRRWLSGYLNMFMAGLGLGHLVSALGRRGVSLEDYHSLILMLILTGEVDTDGNPIMSDEEVKDEAKFRVSPDEDLSKDTGCSLEDARRLRLGLMSFHRDETVFN